MIFGRRKKKPRIMRVEMIGPTGQKLDGGRLWGVVHFNFGEHAEIVVSQHDDAILIDVYGLILGMNPEAMTRVASKTLGRAVLR